MLFIMLPMWMNFLLRTYAWMSILENHGFLNQILALVGIGPLHIINTDAAVILGMVYNFLPFMILPIFSVIEKLDRRYIEAAQDLGAGRVQVFRAGDLPAVRSRGHQRDHDGVHPVHLHLCYFQAPGRRNELPAGRPD